MKRRWLLSLSCIVFLAALISFAFRFIKEDDRPKVIVILKNESDKEFWRIFESGAEQAFDDLRIDGKVVVPDARSRITEKEIKLLKEVLAQNPDALIFAPTNSSAVIPILMEFKKKNIPVLLSDTDIEWNDKTTYIGTDNHVLGQKAGALLASTLQPGDQVALIRGRLEDRVISERVKGAKESLEEVGIEIVTEQSGYNQSGDVVSVMGSILQTYPEIKGVFATSDLIALNALKVIEESGFKIPVIGADGTTEMVKSVEAGMLSVTLAQNPYDMGYISVEQAWRVMKGENVNKRIDTGIYIVTEDNAKEKLVFLSKILQSRIERFKNFSSEFLQS